MDENGKINILDLVILAGYFGTEGNTAKNVTIVNWLSTYNVTIINLPLDEHGNLKISQKTETYQWNKTTQLQSNQRLDITNTTEGYRKVSIHIFANHYPTQIEIYWSWRISGHTSIFLEETATTEETFTDSYDVKAPSILISITDTSGYTHNIDIAIS